MNSSKIFSLNTSAKYTRFFVRIGLLLVLIVIGSMLIDSRLSGVLNSYSKKQVLAEKNAASTEILVLGSSQALYGIDPSFFSRQGFNFANVSQSLECDLGITKRYSGIFSNVKVVVLTISYWSLDHHLIDGKEKWRSHYYHHYLEVDVNPADVFDISHYSLVALLTPEKVREYALSGFQLDLVPSMQANGYIPMPMNGRVAKLDSAAGSRRVHLHDSVMHDERFATVTAELEELIGIWNEKGAAVVLIVPPVHSSYSLFCRQEIINRNNDFLSELPAKHNCMFVNLFNDTRFGAADFYDTDHLNDAGAQKLSRIIDDTLSTFYFRIE